MSVLRGFVLLIAAFALTACGGASIWAPDEEIQKRAYVSEEQPYLMLKTMVSNRTGGGGHSSLLINGSQVVMYDPAGRFKNSVVPERNDVIFGLNPQVLKIYDGFHARKTHHVVSQKIYVTPEVAAKAMQVAFSHGPSLDGYCAVNTSSILQEIPGFEGLRRTFNPVSLLEQFEKLPGVITTKYYENDSGQN